MKRVNVELKATRFVWLGLIFCVAGCSEKAPEEPTPVVVETIDEVTTNWTAIPGAPTTPNHRYEDIYFLNEQKGWLVNSEGHVNATDNGGQTWTKIGQTDIFNRCVGFGDDQVGWIGNFNTTNNPTPNKSLYETTDGGKTWKNISNRISGAAVSGICGLRVINRNTIVAVGRWCGPPVFIRSTDGGATWTSKDMSAVASGLVDAFFFNENEGFVAGEVNGGTEIVQQENSSAIIAETSDGGKTWVTRYTSPDKGNRVWKLYFINPNVGFASTEGAKPKGIILKTIDGGKSWTEISVFTKTSFEGICFITPDQGWAGAFDGMYQTLDGGLTWKRHSDVKYVNRIRLINNNLLVGAGLTVYKWQP